MSHWMRQRAYEGGYLVHSRRAAKREVKGVPRAERADKPRRAAVRIDPSAAAVEAPQMTRRRLSAYPWRGRASLGIGYRMYYRESQTFQYAEPRASLLLAALPHLGIGFTIGFAGRYDSQIQKTVYAIPLSADVRLEPDYGLVRPFAQLSAVALWLGQHTGPEFAAGVACRSNHRS